MTKNTKDKPLHSGHRTRLRNRVREHGLNSLNEHEVLELLLSYAIPRKDTNALAHTLINNFGSISRVIDADYYELKKIEGIGENAAFLINVLSSFMPIYKESKAREDDIFVKNTFDAINYFRRRFDVGAKEFMHVIGLSKMCKIVTSFSFEGKTDDAVNFDFKTFVDKINNDNISAIMMFHTHPNGKAEPSENDLLRLNHYSNLQLLKAKDNLEKSDKTDLLTTQRLVYVCSLCGVKFLDHLIFTEKQCCSMFQLGHISKMLNKSNKLLTDEEDKDLFNVNNLIKKDVDLSEIDLGDVSAEEKFSKKSAKRK